MSAPLRRALVTSLPLLVLGCSGGGGGSTPTQPPTGSNHAPTVNLNIGSTHLPPGGTTPLSVTASDPDGDQVTFTWSAVLGSVTTSGPTATSATFTAGAQSGQATATVTASDGKGGTGQATAQTYIRNPNAPTFAFYPVGSSTCGYGTSRPDGFQLRITPAENLLITRILVHPRNCSSSCSVSKDYPTPLSLSAGQPFVWSDWCLEPACCLNQSCGECGFWTIDISGRRPEPDGGTFTFQCYSWNPGYPTLSCN